MIYKPWPQNLTFAMTHKRKKDGLKAQLVHMGPELVLYRIHYNEGGRNILRNTTCKPERFKRLFLEK